MTAFWIWLGGAGSYVVLAGQFSLDEMVAGAVLGALGAAWHAAVMHDGARRFAFERPALREIGAAAVTLPGAVAKVGACLAGALVRDVAGQRVEQPFHRGRVDDPRDAARRAVVVLTTSLAPDSYALSLPLDEDVIAFHVLTDDRPSTDPRWPA